MCLRTREVERLLGTSRQRLRQLGATSALFRPAFRAGVKCLRWHPDQVRLILGLWAGNYEQAVAEAEWSAIRAGIGLASERVHRGLRGGRG